MHPVLYLLCILLGVALGVGLVMLWPRRKRRGGYLPRSTFGNAVAGRLGDGGGGGGARASEPTADMDAFQRWLVTHNGMSESAAAAMRRDAETLHERIAPARPRSADGWGTNRFW